MAVLNTEGRIYLLICTVTTFLTGGFLIFYGVFIVNNILLSVVGWFVGALLMIYGLMLTLVIIFNKLRLPKEANEEVLATGKL